MRTVGYMMGLGGLHEEGVRMLSTTLSPLELAGIFVLKGTQLLLPGARLALETKTHVIPMQARHVPAGAHTAPPCLINAHIALAAMSSCGLHLIDALAIGPFLDPKDHPSAHEGFGARARALGEEHGIELLDLHAARHTHHIHHARFPSPIPGGST